MKFAALLLIALATTALPVAAEPLGTAFTYQGSLKKSGAPVSIPQDFEFGLYSSTAGTGQVGTTITLTNVEVANGLFNVNLDFGAGAFGTDQRYLQIMVRPTGQTIYTGLSPRAAIKPAPVALSVAAGGVGTAAMQDGSITRDKLAASVSPKILTSLHSDLMLMPHMAYPPFVAFNPSPEFMETPSGIRVENAGTYMVATKLKIQVDFNSDGINAIMTLNGNTIRSLSTSGTPLPVGTTVLSGVEIVQLQAGDVLAIRINSSMMVTKLKGDSTRSTTFDIVRID